MFRICEAVNGRYYIQQKRCDGDWKMTGQFHRTFGSAERTLHAMKRPERCYNTGNRVVAYYP